MNESTAGSAAYNAFQSPARAADVPGPDLTRRVLETLSPCLDEAAVLERLVALLEEWVPHDARLVARVEAGTPARLAIHNRHGFAAGPLTDRITIADLLGQATLRAEAIRIDDLQATPLTLPALFGRYGMRSLLLLPVLGEDEPQALVVLAARQPGAFAQAPTVAAVAEFQRLVAIPLANARRYHTMQQDQDSAFRLAEQITTLAGTGAEGLQPLLELARQVTGADAGTILTINTDPAMMYVSAAQGLRQACVADACVPWGIAAPATLQPPAQPPQFTELHPPVAAPFHAFTQAEGIHAYLGVPVRQGGRLLGLLNLYCRTPPPAGSVDARRLDLVSAGIGLALQQAGLRAEVAQDATLRAQFLEHKNDLYGLMAHQLRTPLTTIKGFGQLMLRRSQGGAGATETKYAERVVREADRLAVMVNNVLDMERLETALLEMERQPFDLRALLQELATDPEWAPRTGEHALHWWLPQETLLVCGDARHWQAALATLVQQVAGHAPVGALVEITLAAIPATGPGYQVEVRVYGEEPAATAPNLETLLTNLDLRSIVDTQSAQYGDLLLYQALLVLRAQGAALQVRPVPGGTFAYVITYDGLGVF